MTTETILKRSILALSIVAALGLSACDGDSEAIITGTTDDSQDVAGDSGTNGDDDSNSGGDATPDPTSVGGTAAKGLVDKGIITAYEIASNGDRLRTLGSTLSSNGAYGITVTASYEGGPVLLVLTAAADTTMICDVQTACNNYLGRRNDNQYGQSVRVDPNLEMYAVLPKATGNIINPTNITPLTHMAAARALNEGTVDSLAVDRANREVSLILGRDVLSAPFVDVTKADALASANSDQVMHAAFVSGLASFIFDFGRNNGGVAGNANQLLDIQIGLNVLAEAFKDGRFDQDDIDQRIGLVELLDYVANEANEAGLLTSTLISQLNSVRAQIGTDEIWTADLGLDPDAALQKGKDVVDAKNFMEDLGNWAAKLGGVPADLNKWADGDLGYNNAQTVFKEHFAEMTTGAGGNPANYQNVIAHIMQYIRTTPLRSSAVDQPGEVLTRTVQITDPTAPVPRPAIGSVEIKISQNSSGGLTFAIKDKSWNEGVNGAKIDLTIATDLPIEMLDPLRGTRTLTIAGGKLEVSGEMTDATNTSKLNLENLLYEFTLAAPGQVFDATPATPPPAIRPLAALGAFLFQPLDVGTVLDTDPRITSATHKGGVVMTQVMNDDLVVGKKVTYTYDSDVDVELVELNELPPLAPPLDVPSGRQTSLKKADYSGVLTDSTGRRIAVDRKLDIANAADFDTMNYRTGNPLATLQFPELDRLYPTNGLPENVRLIQIGAAEELESYYLQGRREVMRDLLTNDTSNVPTNFGILNAKVSSVFDRTGFDTATSDIVLSSDDNTISFRGNLERQECPPPGGPCPQEGTWDFKRVAPNNSGHTNPGTDGLLLGSTYEIQNTEGVKLSLTEIAGTDNNGNEELKIEGKITVDGRQVAIIQEVDTGPGNFIIIYEDGDDQRIQVRSAKVAAKDCFSSKDCEYDPIRLNKIIYVIQQLFFEVVWNSQSNPE